LEPRVATSQPPLRTRQPDQGLAQALERRRALRVRVEERLLRLLVGARCQLI
jgi:hypothetical protein